MDKELIDEFILIFLIFLNFMDFFEILPGDIDFLKKIISWTLLGYLLYKIDLVKLFYGRKNKPLDLILLIAYFLLITKNMIVFASIAIEETTFFTSFYRFLILNGNMIEKITFYLAGILIITVAIYLSRLAVKKPSLMAVLHEVGKPKSNLKLCERFFITYLVLVGFFIAVFNLMMEWLAIAVDASLLVFTFIFYLLTTFRKHFKKLDPKNLIYKIGNAGEEFYESFIALFHSKSKIFLGISGILVLHLLTDIGNFIVPYLLGFHDIIYFAHLGSGHQSLFKLFLLDIKDHSPYIIPVSLIYLFNFLAMLFFLFSPGYIWYKLYKRSGFTISNLALTLFFVSVVIFLLFPLFKISTLSDKAIVGVDIRTQHIHNEALLPYVYYIVLLTGCLTLFCSILNKRIVIGTALISIDSFFAFYIFKYFRSILIYYTKTILYLIKASEYFFLLYFTTFLMINIGLYIGGFIIFIIETKKEFNRIH